MAGELRLPGEPRRCAAMGYRRGGATPRRSSAAPTCRSGITLLELVVALLIISLAVAVAVPAYLSLGQQDDLARATQRVETLFRLARDSAIRSGLPVTVVIDSVAELVWMDTPLRIQLGSQVTPQEASSLFDRSGGLSGVLGAQGASGLGADPAQTLALLGGERAMEEVKAGEPLGLPPSIRMELPRARARFTFQPSGGALADTLLLTGVFGVRVVTIDPWTGDVRIR
jgi:type II secretory pathway pseudopilin PulG